MPGITPDGVAVTALAATCTPRLVMMKPARAGIGMMPPSIWSNRFQLKLVGTCQLAWLNAGTCRPIFGVVVSLAM